MAEHYCSRHLPIKDFSENHIPDCCNVCLESDRVRCEAKHADAITSTLGSSTTFNAICSKLSTQKEKEHLTHSISSNPEKFFDLPSLATMRLNLTLQLKQVGNNSNLMWMALQRDFGCFLGIDGGKYSLMLLPSLLSAHAHSIVSGIKRSKPELLVQLRLYYMFTIALKIKRPRRNQLKSLMLQNTVTER